MPLARNEHGLDDLIAYMHDAGHDPDLGISNVVIRIRMDGALPLPYRLSTVGVDVGIVLPAYFAEANDQDGILQRRVIS